MRFGMEWNGWNIQNPLWGLCFQPPKNDGISGIRIGILLDFLEEQNRTGVRNCGSGLVVSPQWCGNNLSHRRIRRIFGSCEG